MSSSGWEVSIWAITLFQTSAETKMSEPKTFRLPPLEALWPWPRAVNVHLANIEQESLDWCFGFKALEPEAHRFTYERGNFSKPITYPGPSIPLTNTPSSKPISNSSRARTRCQIDKL